LTADVLAGVQQKIVAKRFDEALRDLEPLLEQEPENTDALYMSAVCCRYKGECEAALERLARLKDLLPEHGRAFQEEGHNYRDLGRPDDALLAYARACRFNPALEASWRGQLTILSNKGLDVAAGQIKVQLDWLQSLPKPLVAVIDLVAQGQLLRAEDLCRQFLRKVPHHVEGMRLLADIGMRLGVLDDAELLLDSASKLAPDNIPVRIDLIQVLRKRQKFEHALEQAKQLLETAGYPGGEGLPELTLSFNSGSGHEDVMALIQADLATIGVNVVLDGSEWAQYLDKLDAADYQLGRLGWIADYPIIDNFLYPLFYSESADNASFYKNPAVDEALLDARATVDTNERIAKYQEIERTIGEDAPVMPIVKYRHQHVGSDRIMGLVYSPMGLASLEVTWIQSAQ